jgi:hypothetical protein
MPPAGSCGRGGSLTDPLEASLRIIGTEDLAGIDRIAVEGLPYTAIAVGGGELTY